MRPSGNASSTNPAHKRGRFKSYFSISRWNDFCIGSENPPFMKLSGAALRICGEIVLHRILVALANWVVFSSQL